MIRIYAGKKKSSKYKNMGTLTNMMKRTVEALSRTGVY